MTNAELIKALQCASHFALYQDCYEKNCYANSGKGLYCNIPKLMADAADALEAADKRIAELEAQLPKEGEWVDEQRGRWIYAKCNLCGKVQDVRSNYCPNCGAKMDGADGERRTE